MFLTVPSTLHNVTHTLKSSVSNFLAETPFRVLFCLGTSGNNTDASSVHPNNLSWAFTKHLRSLRNLITVAMSGNFGIPTSFKVNGRGTCKLYIFRVKMLLFVTDFHGRTAISRGAVTGCLRCFFTSPPNAQKTCPLSKISKKPVADYRWF